MKRTIAAYLLGGIAVLGAEQTTTRIVDRGPHHRTWETRREVPTPDGGTRTEIGSYVELQGGLHRQTEQGWVETSPRIEVFRDGAVARELPYQAIFAPNLATPNAIDLQLPDGNRLQGHLLGLAYTEGDKSVLIAEVKDCIGVIGGAQQNEVIFADAFTDFDISVQFVLQRDRISQNVIVHQQLPHPGEWGLTEDAVLEVLTEFTTFPNVRAEARGLVNGHRAERVSFEAMEFVAGRAFSIGDEANSTPVSKAWERFEGQRSFLIEKIPWKSIAPELTKLPPVARDWKKKEGPLMARGQLRLPRREQARLAVKPIQVAQVTPSKPGYLIDWELVSSVNWYRWTNGGTFYISGAISVKTNIFESCVIKYAPTNSAKLTVTGPITNSTTSYSPIVFTHRDDHTVGEAIGSASLSGWGASSALYLDNVTSGVVYELSNLRISHATNAVTFYGGSNHKLRNVQIVNCHLAVSSYQSDFQVLNGLFSKINTYAIHPLYTSGTIGTLQNVTIRECGTLVPIYGTARVTNSLLIAVTNIVTGGGSFSGAFNGTNATPSSVFQTHVGGGHYLITNSTFRDVGTTNIDATLLADLRRKTTYPPIVYSNSTISAVTTFTPQAQRDVDTPDLGFHYDSIDYAFGGVDGNQNLTFTAGTVAGWFRTSWGFTHAGHGIHMADQKIITFDGRVDAPAYWVRTSTTQEGNTGLWDGGHGTGGITGWASSIGNSPEIRARFTRFSMVAGDGNHLRDDNGFLILRAQDCEFWRGSAGGYLLSIYATNCLMDHSGIAAAHGSSASGNALHFRNCTFKGGYWIAARSSATVPMSVYDSAFDRVNIMNDAWGNTDYNYNAYITGATNLWPKGSTNVMVSTFDWQTGALGRFYLPTNSTLLNAGSTNATARALYHFTCTTNNVKETNSVVDMGYHYVATSGGLPIDGDTDGVPDYLEDLNGNGSVDSGETDWTNGSDPGLRVLITRPRNGSVLP